MRTRTAVMIAVGAGLGVTVAAWAATKTPANGTSEEAKPGLLANEPNRPIANLIRNGVRRLVALRAELNLTEDQRGQIKEIVRGHKDEIVPAVKDLAAKRRALRDTVLAEEPTEEAIRAAATELGKSIGDAAVLASKVAGEVKPVLTDEQKETIRQFHFQPAQFPGTFAVPALAAADRDASGVSVLEIAGEAGRPGGLGRRAGEPGPRAGDGDAAE
ncbi:MAG: Spy/CpxP family protein refolding chaperone [Planctomycetes bacterium]|nr:Spy/CpxP family protein refolding chaperone [Planctomycetota bacterium]